jgi:hypothetical protein
MSLAGHGIVKKNELYKEICITHSQEGAPTDYKQGATQGCAIAQAVSRRVRAQSGHVGFVVDKVALGQVFSEYFRFPCQFSFNRLLHIHHHLSSVAGSIGQLLADVPSVLSLTSPQETKRKD